MEENNQDSYVEVGATARKEEEKASIFTDWEKEPTLKELKQDYTDGKSAHDYQVKKVGVWLDNLNIEGKAKRKKTPGRSNIVPKLIRKQAEWRYSALSEPFLSTNDIFNVDPVTFEDKEGSIQNGLVLNNQFNTKIQKIKFIDEYVRTVVDEGTVICRTGWKFEEEEVEIEVPDFELQISEDPAVQEQHQLIMQMIQSQDPGLAEIPPEWMEAHQASMAQGIPYEPIQTGSHIEMEMQTVANHPTVEVCNYRNVLVDPTCLGDLEKAYFVIYSFDTSLSELEKEGKYKNLSKINTETTSILGEPDYNNPDDSSFNFSDKPRKKFVAYEYWGSWDIDGTGIAKPIVCTWVGETMIRLEENPYPDKKPPFVSVQYLPVRKSIYGEPDGELLEDNQKVIGAVTRGMIDIMGRSANAQQASRKDALDVTNKRKFDRGQDYEFNSSVDPKQAFHTHVFPEIPQSAGLMLQLQNNEAESLSGVKAFSSSGITGQGMGENATGVKSAMDAVTKREMGILRRLAEGIKQVGRKFISMNGEFLSEEEVVRVTNEEFVPIRRDDLAGEYDLTLTISTAEADNEKASELSFVLQTIGPNSDPGITKILQADIARLRKMPDLAKKIEDYEPQPDPLVVKKQELEIQLLEAQIQNELAKANENNANAALDNAKAGVEAEKARDLASGSDLKDLDYLEQESGVNQERELEKAGAQANANMKLKAVDHAFKMRENKAKEKSKPKS